MEARHVGPAGEQGTDDPPSRERPRLVEALVRWQRLAEVGEALVRTADAPAEVTVASLTALLDRITAPHRLLEQLEGDADGTIAGDPLAARRLAARLDMLAASLPTLTGSRARAQDVVAGDAGGAAERATADYDAGTLSFDGLVHLGVAAAMVTGGRPAAALDAALDVVLGLALRTSAADRLARGLATGGAPGVAEAFNELRLTGHPLVAPVPMQMTMGGGPIGIPGGPLGGLPGGLPGGPPGGHGPGHGLPGGPDEVPDFVGGLIDGLRDPHRWNPEIWDHLPPWREVLGLAPLEEIDRAELARVRCMLALTAALKERQEPPPPRPARVVWSDSITGITGGGICAGDRIVIQGHDFGAPRPGVGVVLPMADGCLAFAVPAEDWSETSITVTLPTGVASGTVGLVDVAYVRAYDDWAVRMNALTKSIIENAKCSRSKAPDVVYVPPFRECAPLTAVNRLRAGLPVVRSFKANGKDLAVVEPGQPVRLEWDFANIDSFRLTRVTTRGPGFAGKAFVDDPPDFLYDLGPFTEKTPVEAVYELRAVGPCGTVTATVKVLLRKVPQLAIVGVEVTQGIQTFRDPASPPNAIPLVAHKDTIVRVYVAVENLGDFGPHGVPGEVNVSGEVLVTGPSPSFTLPPYSGGSIRARPDARIDRRFTDHTLNFRIPAAAASNTLYHSMRVRVWTTDEVEAAPSGVKTRPEVAANHFVNWVDKAPYKVRYVLIGLDGQPALTDAAARAAVVGGFAMLATPTTDIGPARLETWHTSQDIDTLDGISTLLGHIDDQHDCSTLEWLPWGDDCPDDDGATWVGILPREGDPRGLAQSYRPFNKSRNTAIVSPFSDVIAHELGHTLKLNHVDVGGCPSFPEGDFDELPDGGRIRAGDAFDPVLMKVVWDGNEVYDIMSYACNRWVSGANWMRVFDKF